MQNRSPLDTLIVGASLAGLMAGRALKDQGVENFLVLDGKQKIGYPLKCGEAVESNTLGDLFPNLSDEDFICANHNLHSVNYLSASREFQFAYTELDRPRFERWLSKPISNHISLSERVRNVNQNAHGFEVQTNQRTYFARTLILACGASFSIHKQLGILAQPPDLGHAWGGIYSIAKPLPQLFEWSLLRSLGGYAWCFPKGDAIANIGVAGFAPKQMKEELSQFKSKLGIAPEQPSLCEFGGHYPASGAIRITATDRLLVAGDAAGMTFSGTGEGISYALWSGHLAGNCLAEAIKHNKLDRRFLKRYEKQWRSKFGRQLRMGVQFKKWLHLLFKTGQLERVIQRVPASILESLMMEGKLPLGITLKAICWEKRWARSFSRLAG